MTEANKELKPAYTVEVDDHSDDCGTVYRLKGPNVSILSKDEEWLKGRCDDFNLGFERGLRPSSGDARVLDLITACTALETKLLPTPDPELMDILLKFKKALSELRTTAKEEKK